MLLTEKEAENFLEKQSFQVAKREAVKSKNKLKDLQLQFPWVMKVSSKHVVHKTKIGGTILDIKNMGQAEGAYDKLCKIDGKEVLVQEMAQGQEIIIGLEKTREFDLVIMVGAGGTDVEKIKDVSFRVLPIKRKDAEEMISELKISSKLKNTQLIIKNLLKLAELGKKFPNIQELDINPLIVNKKQAIVVDARMVK